MSNPASAARPSDAVTPLSIIIVNYNTRDMTIACIASAIESAPTGSEIVLVDNGSHDGSVDAIREAFPDAVVIEAGGNLGFARGVNLGVRHASGEYVLLLNPDTVSLPGSLTSMVDFAREHPEPGLYGGRTLRTDLTTEPSSCWGAPTLWSLTCFALGLSTAFRRNRFFDPESLGRWERDTVREVPVITGCLLLMRREDWNRLGGMDESFFLYGEDAEFSLRAARHGFRPTIVPEAAIIHEVGGSTSSNGSKMSMVFAGKTTMLRRAWPRRRANAGIFLLLAGTALRAAGERLTGRRGGTWSAVWSRREAWEPGYPFAETALFTDSVASERAA